MSLQFRHVQDYTQMVEGLRVGHSDAEVAALAVGGLYEHFGVLQHALLRQVGLRAELSVLDIGCGSGRLATQLARYAGLRYTGTDVVPALLEYAARHVGRPDFRFIGVDSHALPLAEASCDLAACFSVFTHMLHEESYVLMAEAWRVLRPGGLLVFSFLEYSVPHNWPVFETGIAWVRERTMAGHITVFMHPADLQLMAQRLGFDVVAFHRGDSRFIRVGAAAATENIKAGDYAFGQSVAIWRKPK